MPRNSRSTTGNAEQECMYYIFNFRMFVFIVYALLASLDSSESAKLIYWVYVGQMTSVVVVVVVVRSDFTHFRLGDRHQTFRIY